MTNRIQDDVERLATNVEHEQQNERDLKPGNTEASASEGIQDVYVYIIRERDYEGEEIPIVEGTIVLSRKTSLLPAYVFCSVSFLLILVTLAFQLYCIVNPPIAIVTITPQSQQVILTGTLQLGRLVSPITISQTAMTPTTGKGHQDAKAATGSITFYNGLFASQTIAQGTILTGSDGVQVITDQDAIIPAGNPPSYGYMSVSVHTLLSGSKENIPAYDINQRCCASAVLAKNIQPFIGGQNERNFPTVSAQDINKISTALKTIVAQSVDGALQSLRQPDERLFMLPCTPTVNSNHAVGAEAAQVSVTVSQACSAVAYNSQELTEKATLLLISQTTRKPGGGYSLVGQVDVGVIQANVSKSSTVFLSFQAQGTWVYAVSPTEQQQIKQVIAGRSKLEALQLLAALPGVDQASILLAGFGDDTRVPKDIRDIRFRIIVISR